MKGGPVTNTRGFTKTRRSKSMHLSREVARRADVGREQARRTHTIPSLSPFVENRGLWTAAKCLLDFGKESCWTAGKRRAFGRCGKSSRWNTSSHCSRHRRRHRRHLHRRCPRHIQRTYWRHKRQRCNRPAQKRRIRRRRW